ncbi:MAG: hypothetical protein IT423_19925 [Pirellulaceae bacterium]|nr:hypothetical protein [Pirellulaceae bacterium]
MRTHIARRLFVEGLENRRLLAGDVTVSRSGADLFVTGDGLSNTISIESDGNGGVRVNGFSDALAQPTSINGTPNGSFESANFSGSVFVVMNGGDDEVRLTRLQVQAASINLGEGNDDLVVGLQAANETRFGDSVPVRLSVAQNLNIFGGGGDDDIRLQSVYVAGSSVIDSGADNDSITLLPGVSGPTLADTAGRINVNGTLTIVPGNGADQVTAQAVITGNNLVIDDAGGPLQANLTSFFAKGSAFIYASPQNDQIIIKDGRAAALMQIITEGGDDHVALHDTYAGNLNINMGDGNDRLSLSNTRTPRADIQLGIGTDRMALRQVNIDTLFAFGNSGVDAFDVRSSVIGQANLFGDSGYDTFQTDPLAPNSIGDLNLYSIERQQQV